MQHPCVQPALKSLSHVADHDCAYLLFDLESTVSIQKDVEKIFVSLAPQPLRVDACFMLLRFCYWCCCYHHCFETALCRGAMRLTLMLLGVTGDATGTVGRRCRVGHTRPRLAT